jgi:DNA-binding NarL/FixJ family response regulator
MTMSPKAPPPIDLLVVDDHAVVRNGLTMLIGQVPWVRSCRAAATLDEALTLLEDGCADVAVVDLSMGAHVSGLDVITKLLRHWPPMRIVVLSMHADSAHVERAVQRGAHAFVAKDDATDELIEAIARVVAGGTYLSSAVQTSLVSTMARRVPTEAPLVTQPVELATALTPRELRMLRLIGNGMSASEVAFEIGRSVKTVEAQRRNLRERLGLRNNQLLVQFAAKWVQSSGVA